MGKDKMIMDWDIYGIITESKMAVHHFTSWRKETVVNKYLPTGEIKKQSSNTTTRT